MAHGPAPLYLVYDGSALDGLLYRIVRPCPPTVEDFRSYEALGIPYDRRDFFRGTGVSMRVSRKRSEAVARRFRRGRAVAALDLRGAPIAWTRSRGRDHLTVWAPPDLLLRAVVQCDEHE
jgi:hypothetical protein